MDRRKKRVALLSVISNSFLVLTKLLVGLYIGSVSVISEAIHSGMDLAAAAIALFAVSTASKPADEKHPFGHGKIENISGTVEALLIFTAAGWIVFEAVHKLFNPQPLETVGWGVGIMFVSAVMNMIVSHMLFKVGSETDSVALQADAWHLRTDVYTSAGVMGGLALIWVSERAFPGSHFHWMDPVAAIGVALLIIRAAWHLTVESGRDLLDANLPEEEAWIHSYIQRRSPTVRALHGLRTRKAGPTRFIEFHLKVDSQMSVADSHEIGHAVARDIEEQFPGSSVSVHVEPCDGKCPPACLDSCLMTPEEREHFCLL